MADPEAAVNCPWCGCDAAYHPDPDSGWPDTSATPDVCVGGWDNEDGCPRECEATAAEVRAGQAPARGVIITDSPAAPYPATYEMRP